MAAEEPVRVVLGQVELAQSAESLELARPVPGLELRSETVLRLDGEFPRSWSKTEKTNSVLCLN